MAKDDPKKGRRHPLVDRISTVSVGDAAQLLLRARERIKEDPVEHAKAAADVTRALAAAKTDLRTSEFALLRRAVLLVARQDWGAAAVLAEALSPLVREHPDSVDWVGEAVARAVQADRTLASQLAQVLPGCALKIKERGPRLRVITALSDLCRRHPGLGLAALPTVRNLLDEGSPIALATFLEDALKRAGRNEQVARSFLLRESRRGQEAWEQQREGLALSRVSRTLQLYAESHLGPTVSIRSTSELPDGVALSEGAIAVTDGRVIYLVPRLDRFEDEEQNFRLYKVACAHEVGRIEFGTFALDSRAVPGLDPIDLQRGPGEVREESVDDFGLRFPDSGLARRLFLFAEDLRVDACLRRSYPGLARDLEEMADADRASRPDVEELQGADLVLELLGRWLWFGESLPEGDAFRRIHEASWLLQSLRHPGATVQDSAGAAVLLYRLAGGEGEPGDVEPSEAGPGMTFIAFGRRGRSDEGSAEQESGQGVDGPFHEDFDGLPGLPDFGSMEDYENSSGSDLGEDELEGGFGVPIGLDDESEPGGAPAGPAGKGASEPGGRIHHGGVVSGVEEARRRLLEDRAARIQRSLDARGVPVPLREILDALEGDPEQPDAAVERSFLDAFRDPDRRENRATPIGTQAQTEQGVQVFRYPEWDEGIGDYRPEWTTVWERRASGNASAFVESALAEHAPMVRRLRREFQMLRPRGLGRERRVREGEDLDLDALVAELVDRRVGLAAEGRVHTRRIRKNRDVAVAFLVDLSASTREFVPGTNKPVIEVEKESLVLLSEALEALGDRYGIFGFSGRGRRMVTFDVFKDFDERLGEIVRGRIGAMTYRIENRDGAAIRHATKRLLEVDARTRLLVLLSDGKPLDCGCDLYQCDYAQADTRMALREASNLRVNPFCITVDPEGGDYLKSMYGDVRYAVIDSVEQLPDRLPAIYRRLTR